jgi:large subunit ribosomal protein L10
METADIVKRTPKPEKVEAVKDFRERVSRAKAIYLTDNKGLTVKDMTDLRRQCFEAKIDFLVVKNTFSRMVLKEHGYEDVLDKLVGPTAIAIGYDDGTVPARVLHKFASANEKLVIKGGIFEGRAISAKDVAAIKDLPTREQALSMIVTALNAPVQNFHNVITAVLRDFVSVVDQIAEQKKTAA